MAEPETTVSSERVFEGKRLSVRVDRVRLADGTETVREVAEHPNAVVIVAVDDDQNLLLVRQYRFAVGQELLELPAGLIEDGDAPVATAQRELREETGFAAGELALAAATLLVPLLAVRMLKVDAIAATRLLALPFVIGMGRCRSCSARSSCCPCLWAARTAGGG